jgi:hypothetical protein
MYCSEYLRNKKRAAAQIISPPRGQDASLITQIKRYANSAPVVTPRNGGNSVLLSSDGVLASKAQASVCCVSTIRQPTAIAATCCNLIAPNRTPETQQYPKGFYIGTTERDCNVVNGPAVTAVPCCPDLPKNTVLVTWTKGARTQG